MQSISCNPPPWCTIAQHTKITLSQLWWQLPCARINHRFERDGLRSPFWEVHLNAWNSNALKPWNTWCDNEGNSWRYGSSLWCCLEHLVSCDEAPILQTQQKWIERFSNDCCKTNTEAITPTNHNSSKQHDAPIRIPSNYLQLAQSAGKIAPARCHWFWLSFSLVEKTCARSLKSITTRCNRNRVIFFRTTLFNDEFKQRPLTPTVFGFPWSTQQGHQLVNVAFDYLKTPNNNSIKAQ